MLDLIKPRHPEKPGAGVRVGKISFRRKWRPLPGSGPGTLRGGGPHTLGEMPSGAPVKACGGAATCRTCSGPVFAHPLLLMALLLLALTAHGPCGSWPSKHTTTGYDDVCIFFGCRSLAAWSLEDGLDAPSQEVAISPWWYPGQISSRGRSVALPRRLISILLLLAGIHPNPGPPRDSEPIFWFWPLFLMAWIGLTAQEPVEKARMRCVEEFFGDQWHKCIAGCRAAWPLSPSDIKYSDGYLDREALDNVLSAVLHVEGMEALITRINRTRPAAVFALEDRFVEQYEQEDARRRNPPRSHRRNQADRTTQLLDRTNHADRTTQLLDPTPPEANVLACRPVVVAPLCTVCGASRNCSTCRSTQLLDRDVDGMDDPVQVDPFLSEANNPRPSGSTLRSSAQSSDYILLHRHAPRVLGVDAAPSDTELRTCPWCRWDTKVGNKHRVAGEIAAHISLKHGSGVLTKLDQAKLKRINLIQCETCLEVAPHRSFKNHVCRQVDLSTTRPPGIQDMRLHSVSISGNPVPLYLSQPVRPSEAVPRQAEAIWEAAVRKCLRSFCTNPTQANLIAFFELPARLLVVKPGSSRFRAEQIDEACGAFLERAAPRQHKHQPPERKDDREPLDKDAATARRVHRKLRQGAGGRAWQQLHSLGIHEWSDEVTSKVIELFPARTVPDFRCDDGVVVSASEVATAIHALPRGAAPGATGWTRDLLLTIARNEDLCAMLATLLSSLDASVNKILPSFVVPLRKKRDGVRPVCPVDALVKVLGKICIARCKETLIKEMQGLQYGLIGTEQAVHRIRQKLALDPSFGAIAFDCTNAFGCIFRDAILASLTGRKDLAALLFAAEIELGAESQLFSRQGPLKHVLSSGTRQGSSISPALFCLALNPILREIAELTNVYVTAYLDDIVLVGNDADLCTAASLLTTRMATIGLRFGSETSTWNAPTTSTSLGYKSQPDGFHALGVAFGTPAFEKAHCSSVADRQATMTTKTSILRVQDAITLVRQEAPSKVVHLLRTHEQANTLTAAEEFQVIIDRTLHKRIPQLSKFQWECAALPLRLGGLGLRKATLVWQVAYEASVSGVKGAQRTATHALEVAWQAANVTDSTTPSTGMMNECAAAQFPDILDGHVLTDEAFVAHVRHRLGHVHQGLENSRYHKGPRHDAVKNFLAKVLRDEGHAVRIEPAGLARGRQRPDLLIFPGNAAKPLTVDVTVVLSRKDSVKTLFAAERTKRSSYEETVTERGMRFSPWAITTRGRLGEAFARDLAELCSEPRRTAGQMVTRVIIGNANLGHAW